MASVTVEVLQGQHFRQDEGEVLAVVGAGVFGSLGDVAKGEGIEGGKEVPAVLLGVGGEGVGVSLKEAHQFHFGNTSFNAAVGGNEQRIEGVGQVLAGGGWLGDTVARRMLRRSGYVVGHGTA